MTLFEKLAHYSVIGFSRLAALLTLAALGIISVSVLDPGPLPVVAAMSLGHVFGATGFACFFTAVVIDAARAQRRPDPPDAPSESVSRESG